MKQQKYTYKIIGFKEPNLEGQIEQVILRKRGALGAFVCSIQRLKELDWLKKFSLEDRQTLEKL